MGSGLKGSGFEFSDLIKKATSSFLLIGQNLYSLLQPEAQQRTKDLIWDFLRRTSSVKDSRFRILFCDCDKGADYAVRTWTTVTAPPYKTHLQYATDILKSWQTEADNNTETHGRVDIRRTVFVPVSATIVDDSLIVLVPNVYTAVASNRPWFLIIKEHNRVCFDAYWNQYENRLLYPYSVKVTAKESLLTDGNYGWPLDLGPTYGPQYKPLECLDGGQQGEVHRAWGEREKCEVALKLIKGEPDSRAVQRLRREAEKLLELNHPSIAKVYNILDDGKLRGFSQEFIQGKNLKKHMRERLESGRKFSEQEAIDLMEKVAEIIAYVHTNGIVHRDIKPENIMILDDGVRVKVLDLGQALFSGKERITSGDRVVGTIGYFAPEQLADPHQATARSDVYSLGVIILELVTGSLNLSNTNPTK